MLLFGIKPVLLVEEVKHFGRTANRFRRAQQQTAGQLEGVMESGHDFFLEKGPQVNEHIPATDQVQVGERRIGDEVLTCENTHVPNKFADLVATFGFDEEAAEPFRGDIESNVLRVKAGASLFETILADVGGEDLNAHVGVSGVEKFQERNGQGISFLTGGTADHPEAKWRVSSSMLEKAREHFATEGEEDLGIPKEGGDVDQEIPKESIRFRRVGLKEVQVGMQSDNLVQSHAANDAAAEGAVLIKGEIHSNASAQQGEDNMQLFVMIAEDSFQFRRGTGSGVSGSDLAQPEVWVAGNGDELTSQHIQREHEVDAIGSDRAGSHARETCRLFILGEGDTAFALDSLHAESAVGPGAGEEHPDGAVCFFTSQGAEERSIGILKPSRRRCRSLKVPDSRVTFAWGGMT